MGGKKSDNDIPRVQKFIKTSDDEIIRLSNPCVYN